MPGRDSKLTQSILVVHRYLAVVVGIIMTLWCLSGFVMMYQAYPDVTDQELRRGLEPLSLTACCALDLSAEAQDTALPSFRIEMLRGDPVLRLGRQQRRGEGAVNGAVINLRTGRPLHRLSEEEVADVAVLYADGHTIDSSDLDINRIEIDQWTVQTARNNQPAYKIDFGDREGSAIYVSAASGEVFQDTTRRERVLTWLGAIPHWLYPLQLRQNGPLWTGIVVWSAVIGTFLAATGLYIGVSRFTRARARGRLSPFRGWWYWHHVTGLVFGVLVLTWVFSGLMTMNPWGALSGGSNPAYGRQITGNADWQALGRFVSAAAERLPAGEFTQLRSAPFDGRLYVMAVREDGSSVRLDADAREASLGQAEIESVVERLEVAVLSAELLTREDSYYYGHKRDAELPVYRVILDDDENTRLYVDHRTGAVQTVGATRRLSRWIRTGLHDFDFAGIRARPVWDITVITLLAGVTLVCFTGTWMALKRIRLDWRRARRALRKLTRRSRSIAAGQVVKG